MTYYFFVNKDKFPKADVCISWNFFMDSIVSYLKQKEIDIKVVCDPRIFKRNDIIIFFGFCYTPVLRGAKGKFIAINTEGLITKNKGIPRHMLLKQNLSKINIIQIWDYTMDNIKMSGFKNHIYVPPGYSEFLDKKKDVEKDLDIIFYGGISPRRRKIIDGLSERLGKEKIKIVKTNNDNHIETIKRAKIVIDIYYYEENRPIDYYRISPLLSNGVFIIHEQVKGEDRNTKYYDMLSEGIIFSEYDDFIDTCEKWINVSQEDRDKISKKGYDLFKREFSLDKFVDI